MAKRAGKQSEPKVGYFIQSRGPGDRVEFEEVYVYGPTRRSDEGIVGHDLRMRPTRLGPGDYTFVASPDDVEWTKPGELKQPKSHAQIKRKVDEILAGRHDGTSSATALKRAPATKKTGLVTVETMPEYLKGSHRATRNWGVYPHNGAVRERVPRDEAEEIVAEDPDGYAHIVGGR